LVVVGLPEVVVAPPVVVVDTAALVIVALPAAVPPERPFAPSAGAGGPAVAARNVKLHSVAPRVRTRKTTSFVGLRG
jgi:hypothetical protein